MPSGEHVGGRPKLASIMDEMAPSFYTNQEKEVVVQGLNGYIVAEKHGQLLVCSLQEEQRIKKFGKQRTK